MENPEDTLDQHIQNLQLDDVPAKYEDEGISAEWGKRQEYIAAVREGIRDVAQAARKYFSERSQTDNKLQACVANIVATEGFSRAMVEPVTQIDIRRYKRMASRFTSQMIKAMLQETTQLTSSVNTHIIDFPPLRIYSTNDGNSAEGILYSRNSKPRIIAYKTGQDVQEIRVFHLESFEAIPLTGLYRARDGSQQSYEEILLQDGFSMKTLEKEIGKEIWDKLVLVVNLNSLGAPVSNDKIDFFDVQEMCTMLNISVATLVVKFRDTLPILNVPVIVGLMNMYTQDPLVLKGVTCRARTVPQVLQVIAAILLLLEKEKENPLELVDSKNLKLALVSDVNTLLFHLLGHMLPNLDLAFLLDSSHSDFYTSEGRVHIPSGLDFNPPLYMNNSGTELNFVPLFLDQLLVPLDNSGSYFQHVVPNLFEDDQKLDLLRKMTLETFQSASDEVVQKSQTWLTSTGHLRHSGVACCPTSLLLHFLNHPESYKQFHGISQPEQKSGRFFVNLNPISYSGYYHIKEPLGLLSPSLYRFFPNFPLVWNHTSVIDEVVQVFRPPINDSEGNAWIDRLVSTLRAHLPRANYSTTSMILPYTGPWSEGMPYIPPLYKYLGSERLKDIVNAITGLLQLQDFSENLKDLFPMVDLMRMHYQQWDVPYCYYLKMPQGYPPLTYKYNVDENQALEILQPKVQAIQIPQLEPVNTCCLLPANMATSVQIQLTQEQSVEQQRVADIPSTTSLKTQFRKRPREEIEREGEGEASVGGEGAGGEGASEGFGEEEEEEEESLSQEARYSIAKPKRLKQTGEAAEASGSRQQPGTTPFSPPVPSPPSQPDTPMGEASEQTSAQAGGEGQMGVLDQILSGRSQEVSSPEQGFTFPSPQPPTSANLPGSSTPASPIGAASSFNITEVEGDVGEPQPRGRRGRAPEAQARQMSRFALRPARSAGSPGSVESFPTPFAIDYDPPNIQNFPEQARADIQSVVTDSLASFFNYRRLFNLAQDLIMNGDNLIAYQQFIESLKNSSNSSLQIMAYTLDNNLPYSELVTALGGANIDPSVPTNQSLANNKRYMKSSFVLMLYDLIKTYETGARQKGDEQLILDLYRTIDYATSNQVKIGVGNLIAYNKESEVDPLLQNYRQEIRNLSSNINEWHNPLNIGGGDMTELAGFYGTNLERGNFNADDFYDQDWMQENLEEEDNGN